MAFRLISVLSILGFVFWRTYERFRDEIHRQGRPRMNWSAYFAWLYKRTKSLCSLSALERGKVQFRLWLRERFPGWKGWVFLCSAASFAYQAGSGFGYAVFSPRRIFGFPLFLHVLAGGVFAVTLAIVLFLKAKDFRLDKHGEPILRKMLRPGLFWFFVAAGLAVSATALFSMWPSFTFREQGSLLHFHRYSALAAFLSAAAYLDLYLIPRR